MPMTVLEKYEAWKKSPVRRRARQGEAAAWVIAHANHSGDDCLPWPFSRNVDGYPTNGLLRKMCRIANGDPPTPKHEAAHSCRGAADGCINPAHLSWKTRRENMLDRHRDGTMNLAVLTEDIVRTLRSLKLERGDIAKLALEYGVGWQAIKDAITGKTWPTTR